MAPSTKKEQLHLALKEAAETDLVSFIQLIHPQRVLGAVHIELIRWMTREDAPSHLLALLPRDHQKSAIAAYYAAWMITRNPAIRILYISSTSNLATKQLTFIKSILTHPNYRRFWPEMVNKDENKRAKWTETEIVVDHPLRAQEIVRDPTVFCAGMTTNIVGMHCDLMIPDDVVVHDTAYTAEAREKIEQQYSYFASIQGTDSRVFAVGTRYDPKDLYGTLLEQKVQLFNDEGELVDEYVLYDVFERQVEDRGDGTGTYLWPRQRRDDGKWFGFDQSVLARKRAEYLDQTQFRAQYYNDPNDREGAGISSECFQYYDKSFLTRDNGRWYIKGVRLNVFAGIDFAFSLKSSADYTAIVVVGVDPYQNYYVLDIDRFRSQHPSDYFKHILAMHRKWDFRKLRAEVTSGAAVIVNTLKTEYISRYGLALAVEDHRPTRHDGTKEERIAAALQPLYEERRIWHLRGGMFQTLEEELVLSHPPHDDVKDCLAACISSAIAPSPSMTRTGRNAKNYEAHSRFGGVI